MGRERKSPVFSLPHFQIMEILPRWGWLLMLSHLKKKGYLLVKLFFPRIEAIAVPPNFVGAFPRWEIRAGPAPLARTPFRWPP